MGARVLWWGGCAWDSFALPHLLPGSTGSGYSHLTIHGYALSSHVGLAWPSPWSLAQHDHAAQEHVAALDSPGLPALQLRRELGQGTGVLASSRLLQGPLGASGLVRNG